MALVLAGHYSDILSCYKSCRISAQKYGHSVLNITPVEGLVGGLEMNDLNLACEERYIAILTLWAYYY